MPTYSYYCTNCQVCEKRIAGVDDHTAACAHCGGIIRRQGGIQTILSAYGGDGSISH